ncbi:methyltransferase-like protein 22 [Brachionichthys hirsutus]|uniref:methyltransferase-like protein 22 n=1 Tax=Brachionichthys hirsutus TaxID=412623 RepID=UPI0036046267
MDRITFHHDTVLSDVHVLLPNAARLMTRLNRVGQPVFMSKFRILSAAGRGLPEAEGDAEGDAEGEHGGPGNVEPLVDEDGDFDVIHRPRRSCTGRHLVCPVIVKQSDPVPEREEEEEQEEEEEEEEGTIRIEHTMATPLEDVGKQVWRGALLLADFIFSEAATFRGATVLELGAGTGLTGVVMATAAKRLYCTDVGGDLLSMCQKNVSLNEHLLLRSGADVRVRHLDWLRDDLRSDADEEFGWTEEEEADLYGNASFIIAADVCYDDELTDGLFRAMRRLCGAFAHACTIFISIERRMNFSLQHLSVCCEAYAHFRRRLLQLQHLDGRRRFRVEQVPPDFPQFLIYERTEQLELWKVTATPIPSPAHLQEARGGASEAAAGRNPPRHGPASS